MEKEFAQRTSERAVALRNAEIDAPRLPDAEPGFAETAENSGRDYSEMLLQEARRLVAELQPDHFKRRCVASLMTAAGNPDAYVPSMEKICIATSRFLEMAKDPVGSTLREVGRRLRDVRWRLTDFRGRQPTESDLNAADDLDVEAERQAAFEELDRLVADALPKEWLENARALVADTASALESLGHDTESGPGSFTIALIGCEELLREQRRLSHQTTLDQPELNQRGIGLGL